MKKYFFAIFAIAVILAWGCGGEKFPLPSQTDVIGTTVVSDTTYLQLRPIWNSETGYNFNHPKDVLLGREPLVYIADTGNDRITMMDLAGNIIAHSQFINNPVCIAQDSKLNILAVTDSNKIYRINLVAVRHDISTASIELVWEEVDNPDRRFTGIGAALFSSQGKSVISYVAAATGNDKKDNQLLIFPEDFDVRIPDALNLEPNGLGILSASEPSGITSIRDYSADFIFCMRGENNFKVQWITPGEFGFMPRLNPSQGNFDLFEPGKFSAPEDVTVDPEGNIYVVDADLDHVFKFSSQGDELQSFGDSGSGEKQFNQPHGVAIFDKTLYVADTGNNRIVRFRLSTDVGQ
jgi:hypothetical protein